MAYTCNFPDIHTWIQNLPPISQWKTDSISICISPSCSIQPSLKLSISRNFQFCIVADYNLPVSLWSSKPLKINNKSTSTKLLDDESIFNLLINFIQDVLNYGSNRNSSSFLRLPRIDSSSSFKEIFNFSFLTLAFIICIYEAPPDLRSTCINTLKSQFSCPQSREASRLLVRVLGSNAEEQWMRSVNLAITNWIVEFRASSNHPMKTPCRLFSYSFSTQGLWKVQLYCPVIAMDIETSTGSLSDDLRFSLNYHQVEGVIQFNYRVIAREKWIEVMVNTDNIRCDVVRLVNESLMAERGAGISEKHFPSRISLQLTPTIQTNVLSISVSKSSENPVREIGTEKTIEGGIDPPNTFIGLKVSAGETVVMSMKPWKFEQSVYGNGANLNWFLHDSGDGREVFSSKPSVFSLIQPNAWFKNRYSSAYRPFTKQGGVIFAGDEYGESVCWKVDKRAIGKSMEWELKGSVWLTYWPNKHITSYAETRRLEFREVLHLNLA